MALPLFAKEVSGETSMVTGLSVMEPFPDLTGNHRFDNKQALKEEK
jgi:hypothetical protein